MENLIEFFSFSDSSVRYVALGSVLLTASSAVVGTFTFLKKKALVGDAIAHAVLPGICLAFIISGSKNPVFLITGALITGWISLVLIDFITAKSKIKEDTAIALILATFFGVGVFLLTMIQKSGNAAQSGLNSFLFGKAASLVGSDLITFSVVAIILLITVLIFFKEFTIIAFDSAYAKALGLPVKKIEYLLTTLTVLAVVIGIQSVGVVLMAAMLITPAAAARYWTHKIKFMILLAAILGGFSGLTGAYISFTAPSMPTGPWIVVVISTIAFFSFFFAPHKGIFYRLIRNYRFKTRMLKENILKVFYQIGERKNKIHTPLSTEEILTWRNFEPEILQKGLRLLIRDGYLEKDTEGFHLTGEGIEKGQRTVKLHRLWEVYLTKYMHIAPDHVHEDAETIEHILTPELEKKLEELLDYPEKDPHESEIPYR